MKAVVSVVKPFLINLANSPAVKQLFLDLMKKYVESTDNDIDDVLYQAVKTALRV